MILVTLVVGIIIAAGSFTLGYWQAGWETLARWLIVFGIFWLISIWRKWRWFSPLALLFSLFLAVLGIWYDLHPGWMFNGAAFGLIAYDMTEFRSNLRAMPVREDIPGRSRRRVLRLSIMTGLGLSLVSLFLLFTGQFSGDWRVFILVVVSIGLLQSIAWLRRK